MRSVARWTAVGCAGGLGFAAACGFSGAATNDRAGDARADGAATLADAGGAATDAPLLPDSAPRVGCAWPTLQAGAPWPMIGGCVGHAGRSSFRGPRRMPHQVWQADTHAYAPVPAIAADDTVYVPADGDGLLAFSPDGRSRKVDVGAGNVTNTPTIGRDGTLHLGAQEFAVRHAPDGTNKRFDLRGEVDSSAVIDAQGNVYTASFSQKLVSFDGDGNFRWDFATGGSINGSPAIGPTGAIYIGAWNGKLFAVSRNGDELWQYFAGNGEEMRSSPVIGDDGSIYIGTMGRRLHAVAPSGAVKWVWNSPGAFEWQMLPALGWDGTIYAATARTVVALRPDDGSPIWLLQLEHTVRSQVIVDVDGILYVGADDPTQSHLYAISPLGQLLWDLDVQDPPTGFAIGRDGTIYVTCDDADRIHAFHE